ncbi:MHYT domain-containing protein [Novosphingobium cyanobacteriorum]|uniref:histidine kinase n=1 Tax=Novosphingobium cyanobacteriorum TaxID=3024215 RepID=A0ABT6CCR8_9SPHN|nr:MHYT domain-containing protein [Novosphingobium cyanobacteriorum]MDF8331723.1 MHYT domain-containing protein [Novosphingobium cyanobacteriorum]
MAGGAEYNPFLVAVSILVAVFGSFTGLRLSRHIPGSAAGAREFWTAAAAVALGTSIWAMHFVAMLALRMPGMATGYDPVLTLLSLAVAVGFTGAGLALLDQARSSFSRLAIAGLLMGLGIVAMHYIGMAAMRMPAHIHYAPQWVAASVVIAIAAATLALHLSGRVSGTGRQVAAAIVMGAAIAGMHFSGMRAAEFQLDAEVMAQGSSPAIRQTYLAVAVGLITLIILALTLGAARIDAMFRASARRESRVALRLRIADVLRDARHPEALEQVARLMGEHFNVVRTGYGQLDEQASVFDYDICWTDGTVPPLLGRYPASAFGEKIVQRLREGHTVVVNDLLAADLSDEDLTRETARHVDTRAILVVPFVREGQLRSIIYLNDRDPRTWHAEDVAFLEELAERTRLVIERDLAERQLRELNAELESRVHSRTAELRATQDALLQSQKMEAVGQLAAGLAHDFNNLLGAVTGAFELIGRKAEDPERVRHFVKAGLQAAERGGQLTGQLLSFSRAQAIHLRPVVVCDVIERLAELLKRTLGPMIELYLALNPNPVAVLSDPTQVEMMVLNLAINARDAMPDGGMLTIGTRLCTIGDDAELAPGDYVEIVVRDTGVGMDEETLRRAMEPFFTTKPLGKGTGLGLAQIYASARRGGGSVRIESRPGAGTVVRVLLPCTRENERMDEAQPPQAPDAPARTMTVLVVDDDEHHREMVVNMLEDEGHVVRWAASGAEALMVMDGMTPDVVLLDYAMPGMNGAEVAERMRKVQPALPIVFASGYADTEAIGRAVGPDAVTLRKPFRQEDLLTALAGEAGATRKAGSGGGA